jgi:hypothetical membrane protein
MGSFTATWLILGWFNHGYTVFDTVIESYSVVHQPISGLGLGSTATAMNTAFVVYGVAAVAGAIGTSGLLARRDTAARRAALIPMALHGVGAVLVGVFTLESMALHSLGFLLVLAPVVTFVVGRRLGARPETRRIGRALERVAAPTTVLLLVAFLATFDADAAGRGAGFAGLTQRALILDLQLWLATIGVVALRLPVQGAPAGCAADVSAVTPPASAPGRGATPVARPHPGR